MVELTRQRVGQRAEVLQTDLTHSLDFAADASFDLIVCPLVLDNIENWQPTFDEFYRTLKPGGVFVFSCGHPLGDYLFTTWRQLTPGNYFAVELFEVPWRGFGEPIRCSRAIVARSVPSSPPCCTVALAWTCCWNRAQLRGSGKAVSDRRQWSG
jgi:SAM-dependent methyltransferase